MLFKKAVARGSLISNHLTVSGAISVEVSVHRTRCKQTKQHYEKHPNSRRDSRGYAHFCSVIGLEVEANLLARGGL